jgi:uncharacterized protein YraI
MKKRNQKIRLIGTGLLLLLLAAGAYFSVGWATSDINYRAGDIAAPDLLTQSTQPNKAAL